MEARALHRMSVDEYVALDRASTERWEYVGGEAFAMAGASPEHGLVTKNVAVALTLALRGKPCHALPDGQKIASRVTRAYHYPDAIVVCGTPSVDPDEEHALINPALLVEVVSPSTADYDRGGKFAHYRTIETLREYVVVDPAARTVELYQKVAAGQWLMTEIRVGTLRLESVDAAIAVEDLWLELEWIATRKTAPR
jgi:Uma2 family endonuclease